MISFFSYIKDADQTVHLRGVINAFGVIEMEIWDFLLLFKTNQNCKKLYMLNMCFTQCSNPEDLFSWRESWMGLAIIHMSIGMKQ